MDPLARLNPSPFENSLSLTYGRALRVLGSLPDWRDSSLRSLQWRVWSPVKLRQVEFLYDGRGIAIGFVSWAFLTDEVAQLLVEDSSYRLDISEWNEGDQLWIIDFVSPSGGARSLWQRFRQLHVPGARRLRAMRVYTNGRQRRLVDVQTRELNR